MMERIILSLWRFLTLAIDTALSKDARRIRLNPSAFAQRLEIA